MMIIACKHGKDILRIEHSKYRVRNAVILSQPLPANDVSGIYTDPSFRIVVSQDIMYYQEFNQNYELETVDINLNDSLIYDRLIDVTSLMKIKAK